MTIKPLFVGDYNDNIPIHQDYFPDIHALSNPVGRRLATDSLFVRGRVLGLTPSSTFFLYVATQAILLPADLLKSYFWCDALPVIPTSFVILKNSEPVGSFTFNNEGINVDFLQNIVLEKGDVLSIVAPSSLNGISALAWTFYTELVPSTVFTPAKFFDYVVVTNPETGSTGIKITYFDHESFVIEGGRQLIIPSHLDGVPVIAIGTNIFQYPPSIIPTTHTTNALSGLELYDPGLDAIIVPWTVEYIDDGALANVQFAHLIIPFGESDQLQDGANMPSRLLYIGESAFINNQALISIDIPKSVAVIGAKAFGYCYQLQQVEIESDSGLLTLGDSAFECNLALTEILLPDSIERLGKRVFRNCINLQKINSYPTLTMPSKLTEIPERAFESCFLNMHNLAWSTALTKIGKYAFANNRQEPFRRLPKSVYDRLYEGVYTDDLSEPPVVSQNTAFASPAATNMEILVHPYERTWKAIVTEKSNSIEINDFNPDLTPVRKIWNDDTKAYETSTTLLGGRESQYDFDSETYIPIDNLNTHVIEVPNRQVNIDAITNLEIEPSAFLLCDITHLSLSGNIFLWNYSFAENPLFKLDLGYLVISSPYNEMGGNPSETFFGHFRAEMGVEYVDIHGVNLILSDYIHNPVSLVEHTMENEWDYSQALPPVIKTKIPLPSIQTKDGRWDFSWFPPILSEITFIGSAVEASFIGSRMFADNLLVELPTLNCGIGERAFENNLLETVSLGSVSEIGPFAFANNQITEINYTIPNGVERIEAGAFKNNKIAGTLTLPNLSYIAMDTFAQNQIDNIDFPDTIEDIDERAFAYNNLTAITLPSGLEYIRNGAFAYNYIGQESNGLLVIPDTVVSIGSIVGTAPESGGLRGAFTANEIHRVLLGNITELGDYTFAGNNVTELVLPNTLVAIGRGAFADNHLVKITGGEVLRTYWGQDALGVYYTTGMGVDGDGNPLNYTLPRIPYVFNDEGEPIEFIPGTYDSPGLYVYNRVVYLYQNVIPDEMTGWHKSVTDNLITGIPVPAPRWNNNVNGEIEADQFVISYSWHLPVGGSLDGDNSTMVAWISIHSRPRYSTKGLPANFFTINGALEILKNNEQDSGSGIEVLFATGA